MRAKSLAPAYERSKTSNRQTTRRTRRFALCCELLESRQLLSVGQASLSAGVAMNLSIARPQTSVPAAVAVSVPSGLSNNTEFGFATSGNLSSTGSLGTANPTNSANASIFTEANVNGSSVNSGDSAPGLALDSNLAVSPLNPNNTSIAESTRELEPDQTNFIIPPPTLIVASVQLGGSSSPATAISAGSNTTNSSAITLAHPAQPTSAGQLSPSQIIQRGSVSLEGLSVIEQPEPGPQILEPAPAPVPADAPNAQPQPDPSVNPPTNQPPAPSPTIAHGRRVFITASREFHAGRVRRPLTNKTTAPSPIARVSPNGRRRPAGQPQSRRDPAGRAGGLSVAALPALAAA